MRSNRRGPAELAVGLHLRLVEGLEDGDRFGAPGLEVERTAEVIRPEAHNADNIAVGILFLAADDDPADRILGDSHRHAPADAHELA